MSNSWRTTVAPTTLQNDPYAKVPFVLDLNLLGHGKKISIEEVTAIATALLQALPSAQATPSKWKETAKVEALR